MSTDNGTVKWFNASRGYGFISPDSGRPDIFVHFSGIAGDGRRLMTPGQKVEFEIVDSERGFKAVNVRPIVEGTQ